MPIADYRYVDPDNHFYEAPDSFYRHGTERVKRFVQWIEQGKKRFLLFGGTYAPGNPNPTFNPVARPGTFHATLKALERDEIPSGPRYGRLTPLDRAHMYRDERLGYMDEQNSESVFIHPTLGYSCEHLLVDDWAHARSNLVER